MGLIRIIYLFVYSFNFFFFISKMFLLSCKKISIVMEFMVYRLLLKLLRSTRIAVVLTFIRNYNSIRHADTDKDLAEMDSISFMNAQVSIKLP